MLLALTDDSRTQIRTFYRYRQLQFGMSINPLRVQLLLTFLSFSLAKLNFEEERKDFCNSDMHINAAFTDEQDYNKLYLFNANVLWVINVDPDAEKITVMDVIQIQDKIPVLSSTMDGACYMALPRWERHIFMKGTRMIVIEKSGKVGLNASNYINRKGYTMENTDEVKCLACPCPPNEECYGIGIVHRPPNAIATIRCTVTHTESGFVDLGSCSTTMDVPQMLLEAQIQKQGCDAMTYQFINAEPLLIYIDELNFNIYRGEGHKTVVISKSVAFECTGGMLTILIVTVCVVVAIIVVAIGAVFAFMYFSKEAEVEEVTLARADSTHTQARSKRHNLLAK